ncbi:hypothetical protein SAMN05216390_10298 [Lachnospiraceae bacterium KH1T2]|nr:hypothetical protein SAMN05216390_10298 [Lachnospiraceae bacterium KH1T2]
MKIAYTCLIYSAVNIKKRNCLDDTYIEIYLLCGVFNI